MPYLHKFGPDDILKNRMETHPSYEFTLYSGSAYINNDRYQGQNIPNGFLSLYEYNVNRVDVPAPGANKVNSSLISPYVVRVGHNFQLCGSRSWNYSVCFLPTNFFYPPSVFTFSCMAISKWNQQCQN